jgi:hypothetical protein
VGLVSNAAVFLHGGFFVPIPKTSASFIAANRLREKFALPKNQLPFTTSGV